MFKFADIVGSAGRNVLPTGQVPYQGASPEAYGAGVGQALTGVGQQLATAQALYNKDVEKRQASDTALSFSKFQNDTAEFQNQYYTQNEAGNGIGYTKRGSEKFNKRADEYIKSVPEHMRTDALRDVENLRGVRERQLFAQERAIVAKDIDRKIEGAKSEMLKGIDIDPSAAPMHVDNAKKVIDSLDLPPEEKERQKKDIDQTAVIGTQKKRDPKLVMDEANGTPGKAFKEVLAGVESGGRYDAFNKSTAALGKYQIIPGTWNDLARKNPDLNLGTYSEDQWSKTTGKRPNIPPEVQERAMDGLMRDYGKTLDKIGEPKTQANLHIIHFLGARGGPRFLKALKENPDAPVTAGMTANEIEYNQEFVSRGGKPANGLLTMKEFYGKIQSKYGDRGEAINVGGGYGPLQGLTYNQIQEVKKDATIRYNAETRERQQAETIEYSNNLNSVQRSIQEGAGMVAVQQAIDQGWLTQADDIEKLRGLVNKYDKSSGAANEGAELIRSGNLNYINPDHAKKVDTFLEERIQDPTQRFQVATDVARDKGVVTKSFEMGALSNLRSNDPNNVKNMGSQLAQIYNERGNYDGYYALKGNKELESAAQQFSNLLRNNTPDEAARLFIEEKNRERKGLKNDSPEVKQFRDSLNAKDLREETFGEIQEVLLQELRSRDGFFATFGNADQVVTGISELGKDRLMDDFMNKAQDEFLKTNGDAELAKRNALIHITKLYGYDMNGRIVSTPIENLARANGVEPKLVYETFQKEIKVQTGEDVDTKNIIIVPMPGNFAAFNSGDRKRMAEQSKYQVLYTKKDQSGLVALGGPLNAYSGTSVTALAAAKQEERQAALDPARKDLQAAGAFGAALPDFAGEEKKIVEADRQAFYDSKIDKAYNAPDALGQIAKESGRPIEEVMKRAESAKKRAETQERIKDRSSLRIN